VLVKTPIFYTKRNTLVVGQLLLLLVLHRQRCTTLLASRVLHSQIMFLQTANSTIGSVSRMHNMNRKRSTIFSARSNARSNRRISGFDEDTFSSFVSDSSLLLGSELSKATKKFSGCVERSMKCSHNYAQQQRSYNILNCWMIKRNTSYDLPDMP
jgi:hypothetical protein